MKINPVYRQETRISARSYRLPLIILLCNIVLAMVGLLDMYSMVTRVKVSAEIQYSNFLGLYIFVASMEFAMLLVIVPALTAGSISGERERQTLNLLLTTPMTPADIVAGKLLASLSTVFLLIISSFPILALVFIYGGVTMGDVGVVLLCFSSTALLAGCVGICCSSVFKRSAIATASSYCVMVVLVLGTLALFQFVSSFGKENGSNGAVWLLLFNPAVSFAVAIKDQTGSMQRVPLLNRWGGLPPGLKTEWWLVFSMVCQIALAGVCLWIAVRQVNPRRKRRWSS